MNTSNDTALTKMAALFAVLALTTTLAFAQAGSAGKSGTTLAGYKTLDICSVDDTTWRYSGEIAAWNQGAIDTLGFNITDFIEYKTGTKWIKAYDVTVAYSGQIPAGTTQQTALTFPYSLDAAPVPGLIRNNVTLTITNHSGGKVDGPNPKATYSGPMPPPPCEQDKGCVSTQGYWKNHPELWPASFSTDLFFISGKTWAGVIQHNKVSDSQGYYQLAHQYIAAVLNVANGAALPSGVKDTLNLATEWLKANGLAACTGPGSCGEQKDWAAVLDDYNNGDYPGGPPHCP